MNQSRREPIRILLIEDSTRDAQSIREMLREETEETMEVVQAATLAAGLEHLAAGQPEVVLLDLSLPDSSGLETFQTLQTHAPHVPVIVLTGSDDRELALGSITSGAQDYLVKGKTDGHLLARTIRYAIERKQMLLQLEQKTDLLEETLETQRALLQGFDGFIYLCSPDGRIEFMNDRLIEKIGRDATGEPCHQVMYGGKERCPWCAMDSVLQGETVRQEVQNPEDGRWYYVVNTPVRHVNHRWSKQGVILDITERKQAEGGLQRRVEMLKGLYAGARKLSGTLDVQELAENVARSMVEDFGLRLAAVFRAEADGSIREKASFPAHLDYSRKITVRWDDSPLGQGPVGQSIRTAAPVVVRDITEDEAFAPWREQALRHGFRTVAAFPLLSRGTAFASFALYSDQSDFFTAEKIDFFQSYAHLVAAAIENARLFSRTEKHLRQLSALRNIDMAITSSLDLRVTLSVVLDNVTNQLNVDAADILLLNQHTQTLEFAAERGFLGRTIHKSVLRVGEGLAGRAALERRMVRVADLRGEEGFIRRQMYQEERFVSYFGVPLITKGHVKGILEIFHRSPLQPEDTWLDFLEALAGQAAIALDNAALYHDLDHANTELILAYESTIEGWARALDYRDKETEGHSRRVTEMTVRVAQQMGISGPDLVHVRRGALLHDIGKLGIPDHILLKPGNLSEEEWVLMKKHPEYAFHLISPISYLQQAINIPYCHHEKWDGSGYPRGLKGEQIPLAARIFAVVDVWDALNSDRPYRPAWPKEKTMAFLRDQVGTHFDPQVVEVFLRTILREEEAKIE